MKKQVQLHWPNNQEFREKVRVCCLIVVCIVGFNYNLQAQDAVFSQFYNTSLYLNPALAGFEENFTIGVSHRSQWRSLNFPYTTSQVSLILPYYESKHTKPFGHIGGFGVSVYNDVAGENKNFKTTGANASFAYNLPLDKQYVNQISFGLQAGIINKRIDSDGLQWGEQYTPFLGFDPSTTPSDGETFDPRTFLDINSGIFWFHNPIQEGRKIIKSINSGFSVAHMNHPNESLYEEDNNRLPLLYKYHGGIVFNLSQKATISANIFSSQQDKEWQHNLGSYLSYKLGSNTGGQFKYVIARIGGWYRIEDSFIFLTEFETSAFKVAFSYDFNNSSLRYNDRGIGTYEVHLSMHFADLAPAKSRY
ncbi:PorP/SprF family type IX secretion system membrane protein [Fulvivirga sediminis]|uniref:PorP/SprF family type IX secretion system membrane protein n=1 Tax=Fulvivirga sediminis TaxID=2803949 RepID=A0A937F7N5_9BACT|nr:PorP/SprF family type IX secretion system membrane protein [Fulvivirga sediminis]MBL3656542.1 PorP/SprF family type IX secretion system membrane protein [Fulvivirga sediminis]